MGLSRVSSTVLCDTMLYYLNTFSEKHRITHSTKLKRVFLQLYNCSPDNLVPGQLLVGPDRAAHHGDPRQQTHPLRPQRPELGLRQLQLRGGQLPRPR